MYSNYFHTLGNDMEQTAESDRGRPSLYGVNRFVCRFLAGDSVAELSWRILLVVAVVAVIGVAGVGSAAAATTEAGTTAGRRSETGGGDAAGERTGRSGPAPFLPRTVNLR